MTPPPPPPPPVLCVCSSQSIVFAKDHKEFPLYLSDIQSIYSLYTVYTLHNDVSVSDEPNIRRWSLIIIKYYIII